MYPILYLEGSHLHFLLLAFGVLQPAKESLQCKILAMFWECKPSSQVKLVLLIVLVSSEAPSYPNKLIPVILQMPNFPRDWQGGSKQFRLITINNHVRLLLLFSDDSHNSIVWFHFLERTNVASVKVKRKQKQTDND